MPFVTVTTKGTYIATDSRGKRFHVNDLDAATLRDTDRLPEGDVKFCRDCGVSSQLVPKPTFHTGDSAYFIADGECWEYGEICSVRFDGEKLLYWFEYSTGSGGGSMELEEDELCAGCHRPSPLCTQRKEHRQHEA